MTAHKWLRLEINGYAPDFLPADITTSEAVVFARRSGRTYKALNPVTKKIVDHWVTESVPALEAEVAASQLSLQNITMPTHVTPNSNIYQNETYATVLRNVTTRQDQIKESIKRNRNYLAKIRSGAYDYVFTVYSKYAFESVADTIFSQIQSEVDKELKTLVPDALTQFTSAFSRLRDGDGEDLSQAMSTCRNILNAFADVVYPAQKAEKTLSDETRINIGQDSYKNRLIALVDDNSSSKSDAKLTKARAHDLADRLTQVHRVLSKGAKTSISKGEAQRYVVETYLLIGELLQYVPRKKSTKK